MVGTETSCPLCQSPRPRGAKRCACNYTFEYDAPARESRGGNRAPSGSIAGIVVLVAVIAGAFAGFLASGIDRHKAPPGPMAWVLVAIGLFSVAGGAFGWSWFLSNRRARLPRLIFGSDGARMFYGLIGGGLAGFGIAVALL